MPHRALLQHQNGEITAHQAAKWIYSEISELDDGKRQIDREIKELRIDLSEIVAGQPDMALLLPEAKLQISAPSVRVAFDNAGVNNVLQLIDDVVSGSDEIGLDEQISISELDDYLKIIRDMLLNARKETQIAGSLRIVTTDRKS